jgi:hypothetical protein
MENLISEYVTMWNSDDAPLEFEHYLARLDDPRAIAILDYMKDQLEEEFLK